MAMRIRKVTAPRGGGFKPGSPKPDRDIMGSPPASLVKYRGPTHYSNWFINGVALAGAYPGSMDDRIHRNQLSLILKSGVTTFVCTQAEYDPNATESEWRRCQKLRPYFQDAIDIIRSAKQSRSRANMFPQNCEDLQFVYFPIIDQDVAPDKDFIMLIHDLLARLDRGEKIYLHCWGGHGRTGTVAAVLLGLLYDITPREALNRVQKYHDVRLEASQYRMKIDSPQRPSQRAQVRRVLLGWTTPVNVHGYRGYSRYKENNQQIANGTNETPIDKQKAQKDHEHTTPDHGVRNKESPSITPKRFDFSAPMLSSNGTSKQKPGRTSPSSPNSNNNFSKDSVLPSTTKNNGNSNSHANQRARTPSLLGGKKKILPSPDKLKVGPLKPASQGGVVNIGAVGQQNSQNSPPQSPGAMSLPPGYITPFSPNANVRKSFSPSGTKSSATPKSKLTSPISKGNKFNRRGPSRGSIPSRGTRF